MDESTQIARKMKCINELKSIYDKPKSCRAYHNHMVGASVFIYYPWLRDIVKFKLYSNYFVTLGYSLVMDSFEESIDQWLDQNVF